MIRPVPIPLLILDNSFTFGGAINSLSNLLHALDKEKFTPILVSGQKEQFLARHFDCKWYHYVPKLPWVDNKIYEKIMRIPFLGIGPIRKIVNLARSIYWMIFITFPEVVKYYRLGRKHQVALVHLNNIFNSQVAGILAAKMLGVPCVAHMRDFAKVGVGPRLFAGLIDHHVAISNAVFRNLKQLGIPNDRLSVVHDAIDQNDFNQDVDCDYLEREFSNTFHQPRYGIFGRIVDWKGIREFLAAARIVVDQVPEAIAFIVGGHSDGDEFFVKEMRALSVDLGLSEKVIFTGYRQDVAALMKYMDVVVHASKRPEPFGMVIIEGMAMGKPVVATCAGGPLDIIIDGETGYLVEIGNISDMGQAVIQLLRFPEKAKKMGRHGRARVQAEFSSQKYAAQMGNIFKAITQKQNFST
jgi:glycosyltransferase involved in cell wall biosynthesis